jgi:hypothetical protein
MVLPPEVVIEGEPVVVAVSNKELWRIITTPEPPVPAVDEL